VRDEVIAQRAAQQPGWEDDPALDRVRHVLSRRPPLTDPGQIDALRSRLAEVAAGRMLVLQAGDCAEDPGDSSQQRLSRKVGLLEALAGAIRANTGQQVLRVGRIAGQFAKPRSEPTERVGEMELPAYRGPMVNSPEPHPDARRPDPERILTCHRSAAAMMSYLCDAGEGGATPRLWTSHEALVLDYEVPQVRPCEDGRLALTSTHWPWIGERTRQPDGAHVALLASMSNPVACKVGPGITKREILELCERLDPQREPGRLTLITRMGAGTAGKKLTPLVRAVRRAGHPVIWLCDPMHGNTVKGVRSRKTRVVKTLVQEVREFQRAVLRGGGVPGGLHLEATPDPVTECVMHDNDLHLVDGHYTTLCDPRLNPRQALAVTLAWTAAAGRTLPEDTDDR
jgi:3-deoxy-7-phosphoheptulonate synthase